MRTVHLLAATSFVLLAIPAVADANYKSGGGSTVSYKASGPAGLDLNASTSYVSVADDGTNITVKVAAVSMLGSVSKRDEHFRKMLGATVDIGDARPLDQSRWKSANDWATLTVSKASVKPEGGTVPAKLTIAGVASDYQITYKVAKDGDTMTVTSDFVVDCNKHSIKIPSYLGVTVKPNVQVHVELKVKDG